MAFEFNSAESVPDFKTRMSNASTDALEEAVALYDGLPGSPYKVNLIKNELRKRNRTVTWALSWETRLIAYLALAITAAQLYFQIWPPIFQ